MAKMNNCFEACKLLSIWRETWFVDCSLINTLSLTRVTTYYLNILVIQDFPQTYLKTPISLRLIMMTDKLNYFIIVLHVWHLFKVKLQLTKQLKMFPVNNDLSGVAVCSTWALDEMNASFSIISDQFLGAVCLTNKK